MFHIHEPTLLYKTGFATSVVQAARLGDQSKLIAGVGRVCLAARVQNHTFHAYLNSLKQILTEYPQAIGQNWNRRSATRSTGNHQGYIQ